MNSRKIREQLTELQDPSYRDFQQGLIPGKSLPMIGVRTPQLKKLAKRLYRQEDMSEFLNGLPHVTFEENQLHAFMIGEEKSFERALEMTEKFLPYIDNWATCDQLSAKVFAKHRYELLPHIGKWIRDPHEYTVRFAIGLLMKYFLAEDFSTAYADQVADVHRDEYYINMMRAWYFATALAYQYESILPYFTDHRLDEWTHNRAIQKARESFRISAEQKEELNTLKIPSKKKSAHAAAD